MEVIVVSMCREKREKKKARREERGMLFSGKSSCTLGLCGHRISLSLVALFLSSPSTQLLLLQNHLTISLTHMPVGWNWSVSSLVLSLHICQYMENLSLLAYYPWLATTKVEM